MLRSRKTIGAGATLARLDDLAAHVRREAEGAEADPFDDAMLAAVAGLAEAMKAEASALAELEAGLQKADRKVPK